jgi:ATPase family protein associated with various cellular activities (AAA)/winged helix domain-containing protein
MSAAVPRELANRDVVVAELGVLRALLRGGGAGPEGGGDTGPDAAAARAALEAAQGRLARPSTLDELAGGFGLTPFERSVLLLAAGPELVAAVAEELTAATGLPRLTFGTALAVLPEAHWSALTPPGPLRRWSLVRLGDPSSPTRSPLLVDERVLHHLAGAGHLDEYLAALSRPLAAPGPLPATLARCADAVAAAWRLGRAARVHGPQPANVQAVVAAAADRAGLHAVAIQARDLPGEPLERDRLVRRMERETVLGGLAWVVELSGAQPDEAAGLGRSLLGFDGPLAVLAGGPSPLPSPEAGPSDAVDVPVERLTLAERRETLRMTLRQNGCRTPAAETDLAAGVFDLSLESAGIVGREVAAGERLWAACRRRTRAGLGDLAAVVVPRARWDDLVLPGPVLAQLRALAAAVRHRTTVLDDWGFAARTSRGLGSTALFAGPSGTGKTMAAEVIAGDLDLDLVHVDLSQVVSKWVGETEKHLRRVFDAAEDGGSVLLFDEADALFGKRSPVRDSHDRYANLEVGYLLQRMESFHGLAVLTTNARSALDPAFTRRLRSIITFPYPDPGLREAMWRSAFPAATPVAGLDRRQLASVDVPGGGIAAIALTAAYLGAGEGGEVTEDHVRIAARWELAKSGRAAPREPARDDRGGR